MLYFHIRIQTTKKEHFMLRASSECIVSSIFNWAPNAQATFENHDINAVEYLFLFSITGKIITIIKVIIKITARFIEYSVSTLLSVLPVLSHLINLWNLWIRFLERQHIVVVKNTRMELEWVKYFLDYLLAMFLKLS